MNGMLRVFGRTLCAQCAEMDVADRKLKKIPEGSVQHLIDPTICVKCGRDNGDADLPLLGGGVEPMDGRRASRAGSPRPRGGVEPMDGMVAGGIPICPDCEKAARNVRYPAWLKISLAALLAFAALSCLMNLRFFRGYADLKNGLRRAQARDFPAAVALLDAASRSIPESKDISSLASYIRGTYLLIQDKPTEALPHLREAAEVRAGDESVREMILVAEVGAAFDSKDYDLMLEKSRAIMEKDPRDSSAAAGVASALACKWAVTGERRFKIEALDFLKRARTLDAGRDPSFREHEARILHRLDSRRIISREEYARKFPGGYKSKGGAK